MTALTMDRSTDQLGTPDGVLPPLLSFGVEANTIIYAGGMVGINAAGNAVPMSANAALRCVGRCERDAPNRTTDPSGGAAGAIQVAVRMGAFYYDSGVGVDAITLALLQEVYASDDHTVCATDGGGLRPPVGYVFNVGLTGQVGVLLGFPSLYPGAGEVASVPYVCNAVATSIQAYSGTGTGVLTQTTAASAFATQDGIAAAVGNIVWFPHGLANVQAADVGPWQVMVVGSASIKWVCQRPDWWTHGAALPLFADIKIGIGGTVWGNSTWRTSATGTIDTTDPLAYPVKLMGTGAVGTAISNQYVTTTATCQAIDVTATHAVTPTLTAGNGSGSLSFTGTGTDAIMWVIFNF